MAVRLVTCPHCSTEIGLTGQGLIARHRDQQTDAITCTGTGYCPERTSASGCTRHARCRELNAQDAAL